MKNTMDFYNKTASDWAEKGYNSPPDVPSMYDFAKEYPQGSRFLDLCCGCGYETMRLHALGYQVVGIDFSSNSIAIARERNPGIVFYEDNLLNDYSYVGKVDAVFVMAGLVHVDENQLPQAFRQMHRVLNPGGRLFLTVREGHGKIIERSMVTIDGEEYDRNFIGHTLDELIRTAEPWFSFEREVGDDGTVWHNYIFRARAWS